MLNKKQANLWVKIVALAVAAAFVALGALSLVQPGSGPTGTTSQSGQGTSDDQQSQQLVTQLQGQLAANPTSTALLSALGNAYYDWGRTQADDKRQVLAKANFDLAIDAYTKYLALKPKDIDVRTDMATAIFYAGDSAKAGREIGKALRIDPGHQNALFNGGVIFGQAGNTAKAKELWNEYLKRYPNGPAAAQIKQQLPQLK